MFGRGVPQRWRLGILTLHTAGLGVPSESPPDNGIALAIRLTRICDLLSTIFACRATVAAHAWVHHRLHTDARRHLPRWAEFGS